MKNPTPNSISIVAAAILAVCFLLLTIFTAMAMWAVLLGTLLFFLAAYLTISFSVNYFIYRKIKTIYKTIYNYKANKFNALVDEKLGIDPLGEVALEVANWAREKVNENEQQLKMEQYRKEFLGNVSHELKTPIFNVQGYIHTLLDGAIEDPELAVHFLKKAAKSADRMEILVKDLLTISELESGETKLDLETFDVWELIKDIYEALEMKAQEKQIQLGFKQGINPPFFVQADKKKIRQVFVNLITNSIKYGNTGGNTLAGIYDMDTYYLVEIADNGIGIAEEHLSRLFERFYRVDKGRSREEGGTGLGLSIVKHIMEAHNQSVSVRSTEGAGSTFAITLKKAVDK